MNFNENPCSFSMLSLISFLLIALNFSPAPAYGSQINDLHSGFHMNLLVPGASVCAIKSPNDDPLSEMICDKITLPQDLLPDSFDLRYRLLFHIHNKTFFMDVSTAQATCANLDIPAANKVAVSLVNKFPGHTLANPKTELIQINGSDLFRFELIPENTAQSSGKVVYLMVNHVHFILLTFYLPPGFVDAELQTILTKTIPTIQMVAPKVSFCDLSRIGIPVFLGFIMLFHFLLKRRITLKKIPYGKETS